MSIRSGNDTGSHHHDKSFGRNIYISRFLPVKHPQQWNKKKKCQHRKKENRSTSGKLYQTLKLKGLTCTGKAMVIECDTNL